MAISIRGLKEIVPRDRRAAEWATLVGGGTRAPQVSCCRVNAGGVPAEWVEATTAIPGQLTVVSFVGGADPAASLATGRLMAARLAISTSARVLTVGCRSGPEHPSSATAEDGLAAYRWLLGEGCNVERTAFVSDPDGGALAAAVLRAAGRRGLPQPWRDVGPTLFVEFWDTGRPSRSFRLAPDPAAPTSGA